MFYPFKWVTMRYILRKNRKKDNFIMNSKKMNNSKLQILHNELDFGLLVWQITEVHQCKPVRSYIFQIPVQYSKITYDEFFYYSFCPN